MELQDGTMTHKYIDDKTISESTSCSNVSLLQTAVDKVKDWSDKNNMKLNGNKTKEMYISFKLIALQKLLDVCFEYSIANDLFKICVHCRLFVHVVSSYTVQLFLLEQNHRFM